MNGTIYFDSLTQLAEFLRNFAPSTATFEVHINGAGKPTLEFKGGF